MKTIKIKLSQTPDGAFRVVSYANTVQLSVGQIVAPAVVENWARMPRVQFTVVGDNEQADDALLDIGAHEVLPERIDINTEGME